MVNLRSRPYSVSAATRPMQVKVTSVESKIKEPEIPTNVSKNNEPSPTLILMEEVLRCWASTSNVDNKTKELIEVGVKAKVPIQRTSLPFKRIKNSTRNRVQSQLKSQKQSSCSETTKNKLNHRKVKSNLSSKISSFHQNISRFIMIPESVENQSDETQRLKQNKRNQSLPQLPIKRFVSSDEKSNKKQSKKRAVYKTVHLDRKNLNVFYNFNGSKSQLSSPLQKKFKKPQIVLDRSLGKIKDAFLNPYKSNRFQIGQASENKENPQIQNSIFSQNHSRMQQIYLTQLNNCVNKDSVAIKLK